MYLNEQNISLYFIKDMAHTMILIIINYGKLEDLLMLIQDTSHE